MNQLALGASFPFITGLIIYLARNRRANIATLILWPFLTLAGMLWAVIPDLPRLLGNNTLYLRLSNDPRCDIFFWHYTIDLHETENAWYAVIFILILMTFLFAAWRELKILEKNQ